MCVSVFFTLYLSSVITRGHYSQSWQAYTHEGAQSHAESCMRENIDLHTTVDCTISVCIPFVYFIFKVSPLTSN